MVTNTSELADVVDRLHTQLATSMELVEKQMKLLKVYQGHLEKDPTLEGNAHDIAWTFSSLCQAQSSIVEAIQEALGNRRKQV